MRPSKHVPQAIVELMQQHDVPEFVDRFRTTGVPLLQRPAARALENKLDIEASNIPYAGMGLFVKPDASFEAGDEFPAQILRWCNDTVMLPWPQVDSKGNIQWDATLRDVDTYRAEAIAGRSLVTRLVDVGTGNTRSTLRDVRTTKALKEGDEVFRYYGASQWRLMQMKDVVHAQRLTDLDAYADVEFAADADDQAALQRFIVWMWLLLYHHLMLDKNDRDQWMLVYTTLQMDFVYPTTVTNKPVPSTLHFNEELKWTNAHRHKALVDTILMWSMLVRPQGYSNTNSYAHLTADQRAYARTVIEPMLLKLNDEQYVTHADACEAFVAFMQSDSRGSLTRAYIVQSIQKPDADTESTVKTIATFRERDLPALVAKYATAK
jgi:hypothetical protein